MRMRLQSPLLLVILACGLIPRALAHAAAAYPWLGDRAITETLAGRIAPPMGYRRLPAEPASFASWLRGLPLKPAGTPVRFHDGREKRYQGGAVAVIDLDVGAADLQQCADAVIRLRAEFLRARDREEEIAFDFTSGTRARWPEWRAGARPVVNGADVSWAPGRAAADGSYASFRRYLDAVFTYAGTISLRRELIPVADPARIEPGHVFIQAGSPGHAVVVLDVAENPGGERVFLLGQSFMPAQDFHVLVNRAADGSPWYAVQPDRPLVTPEWKFGWDDLRRFAKAQEAR